MRKLTGKSIIDEVIISSACDGGYVSITNDGEKCFIPLKAASQHGMVVGSSMTGALVPHRHSNDFSWFAEWVLPTRLVTASEVFEGLQDLGEGGAISAADLGIHVGDILYHAGLAQKIVGFSRVEDIDPSRHVLYTVELDSVMNEIAEEFEEDEG